MNKKSQKFKVLGLGALGIFSYLIYQILGRFQISMGLSILAFMMLAISKLALNHSLQIDDSARKKTLPIRMVYFSLYFLSGLAIILLYRQTKPMEIIESGLYNTTYTIFLGLTMTFAFGFLLRYFFRKDIEEMGWGRKSK